MLSNLASEWLDQDSNPDTAESEQTKDLEAFWEISSLVASTGSARLDLNLSLGLGSPCLNLNT